MYIMEKMILPFKASYMVFTIKDKMIILLYKSTINYEYIHGGIVKFGYFNKVFNDLVGQIQSN